MHGAERWRMWDRLHRGTAGCLPECGHLRDVYPCRWNRDIDADTDRADRDANADRWSQRLLSV